jgi:arylsulfatase A-like enzyme
VDVAPTVLELLGLDGPRSDGTSLVGPLNGRHGRRLDVEAYAESLYPARMGLAPVHTLRDGRFKLIDGPQPELYDLQTDPFEEHNVIAARTRTAGAMRSRLDAIAGPGSRRSNADLKTPVSREVRERLAALGYVTDGHRPAGTR